MLRTIVFVCYLLFKPGNDFSKNSTVVIFFFFKKDITIKMGGNNQLLEFNSPISVACYHLYRTQSKSIS